MNGAGRGRAYRTFVQLSARLVETRRRGRESGLRFRDILGARTRPQQGQSLARLLEQGFGDSRTALHRLQFGARDGDVRLQSVGASESGAGLVGARLRDPDFRLANLNFLRTRSVENALKSGFRGRSQGGTRFDFLFERPAFQLGEHSAFFDVLAILDQD